MFGSAPSRLDSCCTRQGYDTAIQPTNSLRNSSSGSVDRAHHEALFDRRLRLGYPEEKLHQNGDCQPELSCAIIWRLPSGSGARAAKAAGQCVAKTLCAL